ncbi:MAG: ABC transporter ATPase [Bacteroidia bacterium]
MNKNRVWIYLSNKPFDVQTETHLKVALQNFLHEWNAHGQALTSSFEILHKHFIVIKADEEQYSASGCSIDKQFQFIKEIEKQYNFTLFDRLLVAYKEEDEVLVTHSSKIPQLLQDGIVNENTIVFNTTLSTEEEFKNKFEIPLKESWLARFLVKV